MTEQEWLECVEPGPMLEFLHGKASDRKLRLFACGCCRRIWHVWTYPEGEQKATEVAERFADGLATARELRAAEGYAEPTPIGGHGEGGAGYNATAPDAWQAASVVSTVASETIGNEAFYIAKRGETLQQVDLDMIGDAAEAEERTKQAILLVCIFGNPFRPVTVDPTWLTSTVDSLATAIYTDRAFDRMPILADALEDAGCTNADILNHCRQPGEHARGCWVVDLALGKS